MDADQHRRETDRLHLLEAISAGLSRRTEVVDVVASSADEDEAQKRLAALLDIPDRFARAILDQRIGRVSQGERAAVDQEIAHMSSSEAYSSMSFGTSKGAYPAPST